MIRRIGTDPNVLVDKTQSTKDRPGNVHTETETEKEAIYDQEFNTSPKLTSSDDATKEIKMEDLLKLVKDVSSDLMDLDSPEDDEPFIVQSDEEEEEVYVEPHARTRDTSIPKPLSLNSSIPTELKELPSKFNEVSGAVRDLKQYIEGLEIKVPGDLKEIHEKLDEFHSTISGHTKQVGELKNLKLELLGGLLVLLKQVSSIQVQLSNLKVLDALLSLLNKVTKALNKFATAIASESHTTSDQSVPSAGTRPAEGEKNTTQVIITQLFRRRTKKDAAKSNLNKETVIPTKALETIVIPPTITTTTAVIILTTLPLQSPFLLSSLNTTPQTEGESASDFKIEVKLTGSLVESSKHKHLKKFAYVNEQGETFLMPEEEIKNQKKVEQDIKADLTKKEIQLGREELIDLLGFDVVEKAVTVLNESSLGRDYWVSSDPFSLLVDINIKFPKYSLVEDSSALVLQFNLVGNAKLNDVDLISKAETKCFSSRRFTSALEMEILIAVKKLLKTYIEHHMNTVYDKFLLFEEEMLSEMQDDLTYLTSLETGFH
ncbi:hypothetical protein Tco_0985729 [Tanacetum coccineum]